MASTTRPTEIPLAVLAAICLISAELGQMIVIPVGNLFLPAFWPPSGVLVAALILADRSRWPRVVATGCAAIFVSIAIIHGRGLLWSLGLSVVFGLEALAAVWLVRRTTDGPFALNRVPHACMLAVAATIVPVAGGALALSTLLLDGSPWFFMGWRAWWLAGMIGMLVTTPLVMAVVTERSAFAKTVRSWRALEMALVFAGAIVVAVSIFGEELDPLLRVPAYLLPFLLWPVFRFGPGVASANLFIVSVIGLWNAAQGQGPLAMVGAPATSIVLRSQGSLAVATVSFLLLSSVVAERKRVAQEHVVLVAELQQAMAEIKTLRGFIPMCAWCHKVRDDAGFWQQIEAYLDARTDATFSHSICPACTAEAHDEIVTHGVGRDVS